MASSWFLAGNARTRGGAVYPGTGDAGVNSAGLAVLEVVSVEDDPLPQVRPKLPPSTLLVPNPPFAHMGRTAAVLATIVALAQPDPWTYAYAGGGAQGRQPYGQRQNPPSTLVVPDPPFVHQGRQSRTQSIIEIAWQPAYDQWAFVYNNGRLGKQPYGPATAPPSTDIVPNPPFAHSGRRVNQQAIVAAAWQPDPWVYSYNGGASGRQPYGQNTGPPSTFVVPTPPAVGVPKIVSVDDDPLPTLNVRSVLPGWSVDNPSFVNEGRSNWLPSVIQAWQPPDPLPTLPKNLSPGIPGQSVDKPPPRQVLVVIPPLPDYQAQQPRYGVPQVAVSQPPVTPAWLSTVLAAWQPADPQPTQRGPVVTASATYSNPPGVGTPKVVTVEDDPLPQLGTKIAAVLPTPSNPPFGYRSFIGWGYGSDQVFAQTGGQLILSVDNPPFSHPGRIAQTVIAISAWQPPDPPPQPVRYLVQPAAAPVVNDPPFSHPGRWVQTITEVAAWQPPDPQPQQSHPVVTASGVVNSPTGAPVPKIVPLEDDPLPTLPTKIAATLAVTPVVNNPPFGYRSFIGWGDGASQVYPQTSGQLILSVDNPPFSHPGRSVWVTSVVSAWQPPDILPTLPRFMPQVPVLFQPPVTPAWLTTVLAAWQPPAPQPQQSHPVVTPSAAVSNPPGIAFPKIITVEDYPLPTLPTKIAAAIAPAPTPSTKSHHRHFFSTFGKAGGFIDVV